MVTLVLMLLAMNYLPERSLLEHARLRKIRDAALAIVGGAGLAALAYTLMTQPSHPSPANCCSARYRKRTGAMWST